MEVNLPEFKIEGFIDSDTLELWDFDKRHTARHTKMRGNPIGTVVGVYHPSIEGHMTRLAFVYDIYFNQPYREQCFSIIPVNPDFLERVF